MGRTIKSIALRFGLPLAAFVFILLFGTLLERALGFRLDLTILMIALLIATAWFFGKFPGLFVAVALEATLFYFAPPQPLTKTIFFTLNRLALFVSIVLFASSRRAAEDRLRAQRELLEVTLKSIGDAVIATDADGKISFINSTAETLTGWKSADAAGKSLAEVFQLINEEKRRAIENPFEKAIREGAGSGLANHALLTTRDGAEIPIEESGAPIRDPQGAIVGVVIVFRDVSAPRRAAREREILLRSEQSARREAEAASRLKDEFLATVSHELRTPLSAIQGWATMLKKGQLKTEDAPAAIETIERNARLQGEIINDLLDVSRITTGKLNLEKAPLEIVSLVEQAVESLRPAADSKAIKLTFAADFDGGAVVGDAVRLRQIVWNLLSNAVKFTPEGGSVEVGVVERAPFVEIRVKDSGIGIASDFLPFVFDKFRQGDGSMTRSHGGLGLGLSIVRHLVTMHDGEIEAASEGEGRGATFSVRLPVAENQSSSTAKSSAI